eukprot:CAMPEP_0184988556 /NCGR_PEP_ID=MMETSP1098-20130426/24521_1 /TAXON_ID=89044 /ORGANISM="Spumella elongata, Strain CCAP 955/1" /LENGTH=361 /DNA_ID=CAMNT_0027513335 /DNA_START=8 /DNA_END=1090 /DNA_ORIENTATION=-
MTTPAQSFSGDSCNLTQYTIVKGGTSCLFGTCQGATNWSAITADFLLVNLLASPRYGQAIAVNFDRQDLKASCSKLVATWNKSKALTTTGGANAASTIGSDWFKKLHIFNRLDICHEVLNTEVKPLEGLLNQIRQVLADQSGAASSVPSASVVVAPKNTAVVIYSISELILNIGFMKTREFLRTLTSLLHEHINVGSNSSSSAALVPSIVLVVQESLHSTAVLAQIQSLASVIVRVVPNSGTLASTVAAEVQTIRRSAVTGKINESIEMFTCRDSLLAPLKPVTHFGADDADETADSDNTKSSITALPTALESADKNAGSAVKKNNVSSAASQANHNQRLITFDSTDPEFDEDSDPDADLD